MRSLRKCLVPTAGGLLVLCLSGLMLAQSTNETTANETAATRRDATNLAVSSDGGSELAELPDSPGSVRNQSQSTSASQGSSSQQSSTPVPQEAAAPSSQSQVNPPAQPAQSQSEQQALPPDSKPQQPAGTAAAEAPVVSGSPVAEPAGVAIAPAKQHRVRTIVIRVGAIVGAGVALGTVFALTEGTSSHPPGAR